MAESDHTEAEPAEIKTLETREDSSESEQESVPKRPTICPVIKLKAKHIELYALLDTGAQLSAITEKKGQKTGSKTSKI